MAKKDDTAPADDVKITDRSANVKANVTDREKQIAKADAHMEKLSDENSEGAKTLAKQAADEEALYADHANLPPATGKAYNTLTPVVDAQGNKHYGVPVT